MTEKPHQPCPYIACGSSDAFSFNYDKGVGQCFSCGQSYPKRGMRGEVDEGVAERYPLKHMDNGFVSDRQEQRYREIEEDLMDEGTTKFTPDGFRGIRKAVRDFYGCYGNMKDGDLASLVYTYPDKSEKVRYLPKEFATRNGFKSDKLFGMEKFPAGSAKAVTITEGEEDAMSAYQMLGHYPVVSLPSATPSRKLLENCKDWLGSFDKIVLSLDNDGKSDKFAMALMNLFPNKVYALPPQENLKDANDYLVAGKQKEYKSAWWSSPKYTPAGFVAAPDQWERALREEVPYSYVPTPVGGLNDKIRGFVRGGITVLKALPGTGKTAALHYFQHHLIRNTDCRIALLHMEELKSTTIRSMVTYDIGVNVRTKEDALNNGVDEDTIIKKAREMTDGDRFISFDIDPHDPLESVMECIRVADSVYEVDFIFVDHMQRLAYLAGVESATSALTELAVKMVEITKRRNIGIIAISHVNEQGAAKYAKAIEEEAIIVLEMDRDKFADDPLTRNTTKLTVTKNRPFALTGDAGELFYDAEKTTVSEKSDEW